MGVLNIAVLEVFPLVFIVVLSHPESQKFECGPYCPDQLEDSGHEKGVCCGGECVKNGTDNTCKSKMSKCRLDESVRKKVKEETKRRKAGKNVKTSV
ncbi:uncharacterized protein LOC119179612 isoform X2 [Rhipicephalus microplus]|uniref:uncharacterized protein LOC119179612 isoform X2 n=1 Tax=Rhipicephalus microplus TaxID=6941 RepID=UPI003F6CFF38